MMRPRGEGREMQDTNVRAKLQIADSALDILAVWVLKVTIYNLFGER